MAAKKKSSVGDAISRRSARKAFVKATKKLIGKRGASELIRTGKRQFSAQSPSRRKANKRAFRKALKQKS